MLVEQLIGQQTRALFRIAVGDAHRRMPQPREHGDGDRIAALDDRPDLTSHEADDALRWPDQVEGRFMSLNLHRSQGRRRCPRAFTPALVSANRL